MVTFSAAQSVEGIDDLDASLLEVCAIACRDGQAVHQSRCGDQTVLDRHGAARCTKVGQKLGPSEAGLRFPWQAAESLHAGVEPLLQTCAALPTRKQQNAKPDLADDEGIDHELPS